jgi:flagellar basal-body rod protein FlgF
VNSGLYTAYAGMKAQADALEILANNLANANTTGFKEDKAFFSLLNQSLSATGEPNSLNRAINGSVVTQKALNPLDGSLTLTNRDLDIAIAGSGFLVVESPRGIRYTRNGSLHLDAQGVLSTSEGYPVRGVSGNAIKLGPGKIHISEDGTVSLEGASIDRLKIVNFDSLSTLQKEGSSLLIAQGGQDSEKASSATVKAGYLEQSNVNPVSSMVQMIDILRHFEAIQKSVNLLMNDINSKAIEKLGQ